MNRTKSSAQSTLSKPVSIVSQFRFEKVEQLTNFINEAVETPDSKANVGEKVLEKLKTHIKTNYDNLYENYGDNKKKILKHIQAVQTNIAGENAMNSRFDNLVKDKSRYDRLHADVGDKQRKLKKLNEIKQKLNLDLSIGNKLEMTAENNSKLANLQEQKDELEHQAYILKDMLALRQKIQLALREKQIVLNQELQQKKEYLTRVGKENEKRLQIHKKLTAQIQQEEEMEIPVKLAEELSLKMQMYENKHSYNSIIGHQAILEEKRFAKLKDGIRQEREQQRAQKLKKESQERKQLQQLYSIAQVKAIQEQKIKKYCAVQSIQQVYDAKLLLNTQNIEQLTEEVQQNIEELEKENKQVEQRIEDEISNQSENVGRDNIYEAELELNKEEKEKEQLSDTLKKWEGAAHNWKIILGLLQLQPTSQNLTAFLINLDDEVKNIDTSDSRANATHIAIKHPYDQLE